MTNYVQMEMRPSPLEHAHTEMFDYPSHVDESPHTHSSGFNLLERAFHSERLEEKLREEREEMQGSMNSSPVTNNHSVQMISEEDSERKLREQLQDELARKDDEIATLVLDRDKLQSALLKVRSTEKQTTRIDGHFFLLVHSDLRPRDQCEWERKINCSTAREITNSSWLRGYQARMDVSDRRENGVEEEQGSLLFFLLLVHWNLSTHPIDPRPIWWGRRNHWTFFSWRKVEYWMLNKHRVNCSRLLPKVSESSSSSLSSIRLMNEWSFISEMVDIYRTY